MIDFYVYIVSQINYLYLGGCGVVHLLPLLTKGFFIINNVSQ